MTTHVLTPNQPDPVTGQTIPMLGWNFSGATFEDVYQGCTIIYWKGWRWRITEDDTQGVQPFPNKPFWAIELYKPGAGVDAVQLKDTDWFAEAAGMVQKLTIDDLQNYTITQWNGPAVLGGTGGQ